MKITCTKHEKELLEELLSEGHVCLFESSVCYGFGHCDKCARERVEWEIKDGEQDG